VGWPRGIKLKPFGVAFSLRQDKSAAATNDAEVLGGVSIFWAMDAGVLEEAMTSLDSRRRRIRNSYG
jgi:hypothetical protein